MAPCDLVEVSVPAQCTRPKGSRSSGPYRVSPPGGKWAIEHPRVHCSVHHAVSMNSWGVVALDPNLLDRAPSTSRRLSLSLSEPTRSATAPNVNDAMTPGVPDAGEASRVTSAAEPGSALWPLRPWSRQKGSS